DALKPRVILLADEQLTGPARDKVQARVDRFVGYQIETLLKPLIDLKNAEQLTGIARGVAFQLVENFGLLNRRDVADDIKSLDQEARGALRRLGIRFGAYHIFLPALLKPAPASLVTLLWALKNDGKDKLGFGDAVHALAAGRTSIVVDETYDKNFYRLAGFRLLGRRAVRVDILERVADLIRPALAWKPGTGTRPDGAYDGSAFLVTPQMMSILGANAADIEEILKALGYRAEARTPAEVAARMAQLDAAAAKAVADRAAAAEAKAAAETAAAAAMASESGNDEAEPVAGEAAGADTATPDAVITEADATDAGPVDETVATDAPDAEASDAVAADVDAPPASDETETEAETAQAVPAPESASAPESATEIAIGEAEDSVTAAATEAAPTESPAPAEATEAPKPILIWR
ncbi:MAG: helicase, partial [Mesorhizobium sp.]|nr:helicase [Mesorhizobium sp.]